MNIYIYIFTNIYIYIYTYIYIYKEKFIFVNRVIESHSRPIKAKWRKI